MAPDLPNLLPRLRHLLASGFTDDPGGALTGLLSGLAHPPSDGAPGWILGQPLLALRPRVASDEELAGALLAGLPEVRGPWLAIAAARCREAGRMAQAAPLQALISGLRGAAGWVEAALPEARIAPGPHAAMERELLGASCEQAAATPALLRLLAVAAALSPLRDAPLPALAKIDGRGVDAQGNWCRGRLLALPQVASSTVAEDYLLGGGWDRAAPAGTMAWVLAHPWPLLLAMLAYAQDVWQAEGRGGLLLELPGGQNAFAPSEIALRVQGPEGDEATCGTLGGLLLTVLDQLGVGLFPHTPDAGELNARLSPLIGALLDRRVWRYQEGASGERGQYRIHPEFADDCFRLPGSKVFNRTGRLLWLAVRIGAEALYQARRGSAAGLPREGEPA